MMELAMYATMETRLNTFNTLAVTYQDEAYTLAFYMLGDDGLAEEETQRAFAGLYQHVGLRLEDFRLEVLRRVLLACRQNSIFSPANSRGKVQDPLFQQLMRLKGEERSVIVLVDVLGLDYNEAARVLGGSKKQVTRLLALARVNLSQPQQALA